MEVAIAGGHGKIARRLTRLLAAHGDRVRSLIRNPAHADDMRADGAEPVVCDLRAKAQADRALQDSDHAWTIVRPGRLLDDPGTGRVRIAAEPLRGGLPRDDVAEILHVLLHEPRSVRRTLYVTGGEDPVAEALARALDDTGAPARP